MKKTNRLSDRRPNDRRDRSERGEPRKPADRGSTQDSFIFGFLPVVERLRSRPKSVGKILAVDGATEHRLREVAAIARENRIPFDRVSRDVLDRMVGPDVNHQGIIATALPADYVDADELLDNITAESLFVILDGVEDPRNLGAILRSAECAGADGVFIPERRAVGLTDTVAKSSAGAVEHIKVARVANLNRLIEELKRRDIWVIGAGGSAGTSYTDWDWTRPSALVLGGEGSGLHRLVAENCDVLVKIPMYGKIESLNVSVAAGVILFEARRQRGL
jgi:23S rRNA (guanosine2251-2'-O)-methyltransferase